MEIFNNLDTETVYTITTLIGVFCISCILFVAKKFAEKTDTTKDDEFIEKLRQINKETLKKLKKK